MSMEKEGLANSANWRDDMYVRIRVIEAQSVYMGDPVIPWADSGRKRDYMGRTLENNAVC